MPELFVGLMSGTSLDGVDGVLAEVSSHGRLNVISHAFRAFPQGLRAELLALNSPGFDELHRAGLVSCALAKLYAEVVSEVLQLAQLLPAVVRAVGCHGQTVRHRPELGYSWQLNNPALLAELCGVAVVGDLRSRDIAAAGQGAPLAPAFHRAQFGRPGETHAVLNLGGISNLTALLADGQTVGFDCGPANVLMDAWCQQHIGQSFDAHGAWAASGRVNSAFLDVMLREPYFSLLPPKSTGRDLFNSSWLTTMLRLAGMLELATQDVQATLCELTALTCARAVGDYAVSATRLLVCGGGALNTHLMQRLSHHLPQVVVTSTDSVGLPAQHVEAAAFAWLAYRHVHAEFGNLPAVTGATGVRVLGALYPA